MLVYFIVLSLHFEQVLHIISEFLEAFDGLGINGAISQAQTAGIKQI